MEKDSFQQEVEYFNSVEELIRTKISKLNEKKALLREQVVFERKSMWNESRHLIRDFDDVILLSSQDDNVKFAEDQLQHNEAELQKLKRMEQSPYFGRLDFEINKQGRGRTIYIGIFSLRDDEFYKMYVVDWRAPIASMFYNFDLGPAWYEVHDRKTNVNITRKRQYKIEEGRLHYMYDTNSFMYDDILGEALSKNTDNKLKVIIGSIQKEQNLAIRSNVKQSCLIYGLAGSGKTSVGLHRLAYILYCNKDTIAANNILIVSNNNIFSSYISTILPDLGEKAAKSIIFNDLLEATLDKDIEIEDYYDQLNQIANCPSSARAKWIKIKYSLDMLQYCIDYFASFSFQIPEIRYKNEIIVSPELFQNKWNSMRITTFKSRYEKINSLIKQMIEDYFLFHKDEICNDINKSQDEFLSAKEIDQLYKKSLRKYIKLAQDEIIGLNRLHPEKQLIDVLTSYLGKIEEKSGEVSREVSRIYNSLRCKKLFYEDALLFLLIKVLMGEVLPFLSIYHIVIDESQDYNLIQLYIMKNLFPRSSFTLLADIYQTINSVTTIQQYDLYEKIFGSDLIKICLNKCYRSSSDISALAFQLINEVDHPIEKEYSYFARTVTKPQYIMKRDTLSCIEPILKQLEKYNSVAIITNSDKEAVEVKSYLQGYCEAQLIVSPSDEIKSKLVIIPLLLAKGLEFDAVILVNCIYSNKNNEHIRRKVYLGCTRALHELYFIEKDALPNSFQECIPYMEIKDWSDRNEKSSFD